MTTARHGGTYLVYRDGMLGNDQTAVLFFTCATCTRYDSELTQWYGSTGLPLTTYKVDFDTRGDLKSTYGVTQQETFVKVDGDGQLLEKLENPSVATLKAFLMR